MRVGILDVAGNTVVQHTYDILGKLLNTTGTFASTIGAINPLRYRGYYYDTETELYYLQSRYYSPDLMRFWSMDDPILSNDQGEPLGSNLYAYCVNEPIVHIDPTGTDAIILQSEESVCKLGHTGLLFQYNNYWCYWYWGFSGQIAPYQYAISMLVGAGKTFKLTKSSALTKALFPLNVWRTLNTTVRAKYKLTRICKSGSIICGTTLRTIDKALKNANAGYKQTYEKGLYIQGDFSKAYAYFSTLSKKLNYNLMSNNCMQTSMLALNCGTFKFNNSKNHMLVNSVKNLVIPNLAYNQLNKYFTSLRWSCG